MPTDDAAIRAALPGRVARVDRVAVEPGLDVVDIAALAAAAHDAGALVAVDNTLATPLRQRPLELGADIAVASATKQLCGHSDVLLGYVATREPAPPGGAAQSWRTDDRRDPRPFEAWLAHRSLATLAVGWSARRPTRRGARATLLRARDDVHDARWPGLGCVLVLRRCATRSGRRRFLAASQLVAEATSFGGVHTTAERRARWGEDDVSPGLMRFSVGIEDVRDLLADVRGALDRFPQALARRRRPPPAGAEPSRPRLRRGLSRQGPHRGTPSVPVPMVSVPDGAPDSIHVCSACGHIEASWHGQCPGCGRGTRSSRSARPAPARRRRARRPRARAAPARRGAAACALREVARPRVRRGSRPASASSTACSAAASCPARSSCSAARPGSASPR